MWEKLVGSYSNPDKNDFVIDFHLHVGSGGKSSVWFL